MVITRFAPSPTGRLHAGNLRLALLNFLYSLQHQGKFILRIDDTDQERSCFQYEQAIYQDLQWLGLRWDLSFRQSSRDALYQKAVQNLKDQGLLYPCYETLQELEEKRQQKLTQGLPPIYDRSALSQDFTSGPLSGRKPYWRFLLTHQEEAWDDLVQGPCHYHTQHLSDPVLVRQDGSLSYLLSSVVDDQDPAHPISHVIRGADHITNTAIQRQLFAALKRPYPVFGHVSLVSDASGQKLSKRQGSTCAADLQEEGFLPLAVAKVLAELGTSKTAKNTSCLQDLAQDLDFSAFGLAQPRLDSCLFAQASGKLFAKMTDQEVKAFFPSINEAFWPLIQGEVHSLQEIQSWHSVIDPAWHGPKANPEDQSYLRWAGTLLKEKFPDLNVCESMDLWQWKNWLKELKQQRQGPELFRPLRQSLTGKDHGPPLPELLAFLGKEMVQQRLKMAVQD